MWSRDGEPKPLIQVGSTKLPMSHQNQTELHAWQLTNTKTLRAPLQHPKPLLQHLRLRV